MTKKHGKVTISLKLEDQPALLEVRRIFEAKFNRPLSLAEVIRLMTAETVERHAA